MICKRCRERGRPANFGSEPKCAFRTGEFTSDNWQCATALEIRTLMGEEGPMPDGFYIRQEDQSYGALCVPPNPNDIPEGDEVGPWRCGGLIAGYWYKNRGQTEMLIRVDPRNGGMEEKAALRLTLVEAEAALENFKLDRP